MRSINYIDIASLGIQTMGSAIQVNSESVEAFT
jgi:hypothetical protein